MQDRSERFALVQLALSNAVVSFTKFGVTVTDSIILGHLGTLELAAVSWVNIWMVVSLAPIMFGICPAIQVLCSQSYGARQYVLVGNWLQVAIVTSSAVVVPIMISWWFLGDILLLVAVPHTISGMATVYARISIIGLIPTVLLESYEKFLLAQAVQRPVLIVSGSFLVVNGILNWVLVHGCGGWTGWGFNGSAYASALTKLLQMLALFVYGNNSGVDRRTWGGWHRVHLDLSHVRPFLWQAIPMFLGGGLLQWQLQALAFMAARLGNPEIASNSIMLQLYLLMSVVLIGFQEALTQRVGFLLGAGLPDQAKRVVGICLKCCMSVGIVVGSAFILCRSEVGKIYSTDREVLQFTSEISLLVGASCMAMSLFYTSVGILQGQGRPLPLVLGLLVGGWCVGIPSAYTLAYTDGRGVLGLWQGMAIGLAVTIITAVMAAWQTNWSATSQRVINRSTTLSLGSRPLGQI